jgi:GNAT superfamily N-acetyltransferase
MRRATLEGVRAAEAAEIDHLAKVWFDGWQDAHARILPAELTRIRTLQSFRDRLEVALADVRVAGPFPTPVGFCMLKSDELYQLYVSAEARGTGVAAALVADAEARLAADGVALAWLACAVGNERGQVLREVRLAPCRDGGLSARCRPWSATARSLAV